MKKFVCSICGYIHQENEAPENCPQCKAPKGKFSEKVEGVMEWADEHKVGIAQGVDPVVLEG